ncbi:MAG: hypothetical protein ACKVQJ_05255 [Pyrinomonadaceae bacterium]
MKDFKINAPLRLLKTLRRYQLALACVVIALCFALGNDYYRAKAIVLKNKDLLPQTKRVVDYLDAAKHRPFRATLGSDLKRRYLIDPKAAKQKTFLRALAGGGAVCPPTSAFYPSPLITALPFDDVGTTVGAGDDYDLSGDPQLRPLDPASCPTCACPTCVATSGGYPDNGITYYGSGTGMDTGYKIQFASTGNITVTLDPINTNDMGVYFFGSVCSSNPNDVIVLADNIADGSGGGSNAETFSVTNIPAGSYNIVVDGYTYANDPPTEGPYTLHVDCVPTETCVQPVGRRPRRGGG